MNPIDFVLSISNFLKAQPIVAIVLMVGLAYLLFFQTKTFLKWGVGLIAAGMILYFVSLMMHTTDAGMSNKQHMIAVPEE